MTSHQTTNNSEATNFDETIEEHEQILRELSRSIDENQLLPMSERVYNKRRWLDTSHQADMAKINSMVDGLGLLVHDDCLILVDSSFECVNESIRATFQSQPSPNVLFKLSDLRREELPLRFRAIGTLVRAKGGAVRLVVDGGCVAVTIWDSSVEFDVSGRVALTRMGELFTGEFHLREPIMDEVEVLKGRGTLTCSNIFNRSYKASGEFEHGRLHGEVHTFYPAGDKYTSKNYSGSMRHGEPNGKGVQVFRWHSSSQDEYEVDSYDGDFKNGHKHGHGRRITCRVTLDPPRHKLEIHTGLFDDGHMCGMGVNTTYDSSSNTVVTRRGTWDFLWMNGRGEVSHKSDEQVWGYEGHFVRGRYTGYGHETKKNGDSYNGDFHGGYKHGSGTLDCNLRRDTNIEMVIGVFRRGRKHGACRVWYKDWVYPHEAAALAYQSWGRKTSKYGIRRVARDVVKQVKGLDELSDIDVSKRVASFFPTMRGFAGFFRRGQKHGIGTVFYRNGCRFTGMWKNGRKHGPGIYSIPGTKFERLEQRWYRGKLQRKSPEDARARATVIAAYEASVGTGVVLDKCPLCTDAILGGDVAYSYDCGHRVCGCIDYFRIEAFANTTSMNTRNVECPVPDWETKCPQCLKASASLRRLH